MTWRPVSQSIRSYFCSQSVWKAYSGLDRPLIKLPLSERSDQATNPKYFDLHFELSIKLRLPWLPAETRLWLVPSLRQNIEKQPDYWIYPVPHQQLWNGQWREWWNSVCHPCWGLHHLKKLSTIPRILFRCNLGHLALENGPYQPVATIHVCQGVPRSLTSEKKDVPVYPLRCVQDISASITLAPIQPINAALPQSVHWLARSSRQLGPILGRQKCGETSSDGSMRSHRNSHHLLQTVGQ